MDINSETLSRLLLEIEKVRRRKIADYKTDKKIEYIDTVNNLDKIAINNNHLIFGRRGCGKTTLILASLNRNNQDMVCAIDIQPLKNDNPSEIILKILFQTLKNLYENYIPLFEESESAYKSQFCGLSGIKALMLRKRIQKVKENYLHEIYFKHLLEAELELLDKLKYIPEEVSFIISQEDTQSNSSVQKDIKTKASKINFSAGAGIQNKYLNLQGKIDATISACSENISQYKSEHKTEIVTSFNKTYSKMQILQDQRENVAFLINELKNIHNRSVVIYLDDFYQIPIEKQPPIIQYFHDIYKYCSDYSLLF